MARGTESGLGACSIHGECLEMVVRKRCAVRDVLVELDVLAGRMAIQRAGRGEEYAYGPMTGKLVSTTTTVPMR